MCENKQRSEKLNKIRNSKLSYISHPSLSSQSPPSRFLLSISLSYYDHYLDLSGMGGGLNNYSFYSSSLSCSSHVMCHETTSVSSMYLKIFLLYFSSYFFTCYPVSTFYIKRPSSIFYFCSCDFALDRSIYYQVFCFVMNIIL